MNGGDDWKKHMRILPGLFLSRCAVPIRECLSFYFFSLCSACSCMCVLLFVLAVLCLLVFVCLPIRLCLSSYWCLCVFPYVYVCLPTCVCVSSYFCMCVFLFVYVYLPIYLCLSLCWSSCIFSLSSCVFLFVSLRSCFCWIEWQNVLTFTFVFQFD